MRPTKTTPAIDLLEREIAAREALDPHFFDDAKSDSLKHMVEMGIEMAVAKRLLNHA